MKIFELSKAMGKNSYIDKVIYFFIFIVVPILFALSAQIKLPLQDGFHEGEYLVPLTAVRDYYRGISAFPVLVHGAMDFIPALIANMVAGQDHLIVWTRLINTLVVAICWVAYMDVGRTVLRKHPQRLVSLGTFVAVFFLMTNAADVDPVHRQQAFIGTRDLFLMLTIWGAFKADACDHLLTNLALLAFSGLSAALCLYWSYDRGVISGIWMLVLSVGLIAQNRYKGMAAMLMAYVTAMLVVSSTRMLGTIGENLHNVVYWVKSSGDVWSMSFKSKSVALPSAFSLMLFSLLVLAFAAQWLLKNRRHHFAPYVLGVAAMQAVFLTKLYNLPFFPTNYYFIWPTIILLAMMAPEMPWAKTINGQLSNFWQAGHGWHAASRGNKVLISALAVLTLSFFTNAVVFSIISVRAAIKNPADIELLDTERYALDGLDTKNVSCVLLWTNEGAVSLFLKKPSCTNYTYPVYISQAQEATVLDELRKNPPGLIVYDSPFWSTNIYFRTMKERLPAIDQFINDNYVFSKNRSGYVFATPKQK